MRLEVPPLVRCDDRDVGSVRGAERGADAAAEFTGAVYESIQEVAEDLQQTIVPPGVHEPLIDDRADSHDALADELTNMYDDRYDES